MSAKNKNIVLGFMNEFIGGNESSFINYLTDDIRWNIVGMPPIRGKENFIQAMEMMDLWKSSLMKGGRTSAKVEKIIAEKEYVVVESSGLNHNSANCDIYRIINGKIGEVTTYLVDTTLNE